MNESRTVERILAEVAEREGVRPTRLNPVLSDVVDPDALGRVLRNTRGEVTFEYHGYTVSVTEDGAVTVA
ncbi:HalOD1 output domain-containing protein [Halobaculum lipolyticum]|uniref:HalOD1 output domain-containing protein n=1 Tax=Halobaculum lipolyticum TaxID=3032001 RepID=A0ABD5W9F7_9EURY|nr:HalOD1 output domain-containing protein [Halobaculum sp. DT31]